MKRFIALLLALSGAAVAADKPPAPAPAPDATKAAALVFDPTNLVQNILQVYYQIDAIRKQVEQIGLLDEQLDVQEDILDATSGVRGAIADLVNAPEMKQARRYMPADFLCAMNVGAGNCSGGSSAFSQNAAFLNTVMATPQAGDLYLQGTVMAPEQHAAYYWSQNGANAVLASSLTISEQSDQSIENIEELIDEIKRGHAKDLKGSTDLNTRAVLELANQQNLTNRLLSQIAFMEAMNAQREVANTASSAAILRRTQPVSADSVTEIYP